MDMGAHEHWKIPWLTVERGRIWKHIYFFFPIWENIPEDWIKVNYPDAHARLVELLSTPEEVERIAAH